MSEVAGRVRCGAWLENQFNVSKRLCVLAAGHYVQEDEGAGAQSWHTDCPDVAGEEYPPGDHYQHRHNENDHACAVWGDQAEGAHPSDVVTSEPDKGTGRTVTDLGNFEANLMIGGASMRARGPARFVSNLVRSFADAFEEEMER